MEYHVVKVHEGQLRGVCEENINEKRFIAFRGVPYAKPPIGNLRFKDCEPPEQWRGVRDALNFGGLCAQRDLCVVPIVGSDDCLYLNVYTPILKPPIPKAVMVWIHGGGFGFGSGDSDFHGPDYLIEKDIVLVTINYRVGIFGFLNVDDIEAPGNQGLKDQVQALRWVQQNIAQFGGNPKNVTIFGQSAGAASVHYLTLSPLTQGLFHKAILQSGVAINPWATSAVPPMESVKKLAAVLDKKISNVKEFVNYLRTVDARRLVEAEYEMRTEKDKLMFILPFLPSIDSKAKKPFLIKPPEEAVKAGIKVPCMCGYITQDGLPIGGGLKDKAYDEINADLENLLIHPIQLRFLKQHNMTVDDFKRCFFGDEEISSENANKYVDMISAIEFIIDIHNTVEIQSKIRNIPMYFYVYEYELEYSIMKKLFKLNVNGNCHGDDLSLLFYSKIREAMGHGLSTPGSIDRCHIQRFTEMWTNFAKTGNPTPTKTDLIPVVWEPIDNSNEYKCLKITDKLTMGTVKNMTKQLIDKKNQRS